MRIKILRLRTKRQKSISLSTIGIAIMVGAVLSYLPGPRATAITMTMPSIDWIMDSGTVLSLTNSSNYLSDFGSNRVFVAIGLQGGSTGAFLSIPLASGQSVDTTTGRVINLANGESVTTGFGYCNNTLRNNLNTGFGTNLFCDGTNSLNQFTGFSMRGTQTNINTLLGQLTYTRASASDRGSPSIVIAATIDVPGITYYFDGLNDHYYRVGHYRQTNDNGALPAETAGDPGYYCSSNTVTSPTRFESTTVDTNYQNALAAEGLVVRTKVKRGDSSTSEGFCSWNEANRLAGASTFKGQSGYLANITSADENNLLRRNLAGAINVWIGGTDGACIGSHTNTSLSNFNINSDTSSASACSGGALGGTEGVYRYYDGPERHTVFWRWSTSSGPTTSNYGTYERGGYGPGSGATVSGQYSNWSTNEPNNSSSVFIASTSASDTFRTGDPQNPSQNPSSGASQGEDNIVFNWNTADGRWNDLHQREPTVNFYGFIIEYGGTGFDNFSGILRENKPILFATPERQIPQVIPVDPQTSSVFLPNTILVRNIPNILVCFNQWDDNGVTRQTSSPKIAFDYSTQNVVNDATAANALRVSGDRTTELRLWRDSATVFSAINSVSGINVYFTDSSRFDTSYFVRIRVVPIANTFPEESCRSASIEGSRTIELRPFGVERTVRKPNINLKR